MPDLIYKKRRDLVYIEAMSTRGQEWLDKHITLTNNFLVVQVELLEELINIWKDADLDVDER